ncbi:MAG: 30S ribosomal protein S6 [bacterium]|nr:30S ribosomal protein S6 [bacterium]
MAKGEKVHEHEALESEGSESRVYELGFHLDPELPTEEVKKAYQAVRSLIEGKGSIVVESEPEKIQLAYTISRQEVAGRRDFDSAYFSWVVYETSAENHAEILSAINAEKRIVRFIDLITTKEAARHFIEARELAIKAPETAEDAEAVLSTDLDAAIESAVI